MKENFEPRNLESEAELSNSLEFDPEILKREKSIETNSRRIEEATDQVAVEHPEFAEDAKKLKKKTRLFTHAAQLAIQISLGLASFLGWETTEAFYNYEATTYSLEERTDKDGKTIFL